MISTALRGLLGRKGLGYMRSLPDSRDIPRSLKLGASAALPRQAMEGARRVVLRNQGSSSSCTTHAIDHAQQAIGGHKGDTSRRSVQAPYWNARALANLQKEDDGAYLRDALRAYSHLGSPPDVDAPLKWSTVNRQPSALAYRNGIPWRGLRYSAIVGTDDQILHAIRDALAHNKAIVGGWQVDKAFMEGSSHTVSKVRAGESLGGHAMGVTGYEDNLYRVPNSWGLWRDSGQCWFTAGAILEAAELWVVEGWL